jgi:hypothetical protein
MAEMMKERGIKIKVERGKRRRSQKGMKMSLRRDAF